MTARLSFAATTDAVTSGAGTAAGSAYAFATAVARAVDADTVFSMTMEGGLLMTTTVDETASEKTSVSLSVGEAGSGGRREMDAHATPTHPSVSFAATARSTDTAVTGAIGPVVSVDNSCSCAAPEAVPHPSVAPSGGTTPELKSACCCKSAR